MTDNEHRFGPNWELLTDAQQFSIWTKNDKHNPVISAGMPKSSDHGWQTSGYGEAYHKF